MSDRDLLASQEFITSFYVATHVNLSQRLILWCLERNPANRPTAKMLLTSGLMPRKVELEQRYLDEVLQTLSDPQSEQSYQSILAKLFQRPNPKVSTVHNITATFSTVGAFKSHCHKLFLRSQHVLITYDTDLAVKTNNNRDLASHMLLNSLSEIKGSSWSSHR